jgi:NADPH:quinone reductase-like Zn-dependent oxidoreductase
MSAVRLHASGATDELRDEQVPTPEPGPNDALLRVHAASITRDELLWPERFPVVPAHEVSGVVVRLGEAAGGIAAGDAVYGLIDFSRDGAAADYVAVRAADLAPKPETLDHVESAAVPLAGLTAWQALFDHAHLDAGQRILIHGAAGGVGTFAVQLARRHGAHVVATASARNHDLVRGLGANEVIDRAASSFEDVAGNVDVVLDTVGGETLERSFDVLPDGGTLVSVAEEPSPERASARDITVVYFVVEPDREQLVRLGQLLDTGEIRPVVDRVFPLADARRAFEHAERGHGPGKTVLSVSPAG